MLRFEKLSLQGFKSFCDPTEVLFDEEGITAVVGPNGCGKCVDGDTMVTLADGRDVMIRELVEAALQEAELVEELDDGLLTRANPQGVEILTLNPATLRLEPRPVSGFVKRTATPYLLRIRTRGGREVTATPYHPLFTLESGRIRALKADELQVGAQVAAPRHWGRSPREIKRSLSEGHSHFRTSGGIAAGNMRPFLEEPSHFRTSGGIAAGNMRPFLEEPSHFRCIANVTYSLRTQQPPSHFRRDLLLANASLTQQPQCAIPLSDAGIADITIVGLRPPSWPRWSRPGVPLSDSGFDQKFSDVCWDEIASIERIKPRDGWVYDLSVAGTHNFVAGNLIVHNSNIADGISWVIGEQRAKALRGGKMEDVIFQGSRNRQPSGMAEVVLTLVVQETFEVRSEAQPESEALKQAEESLAQAERGVGAVDQAVATNEDEAAAESGQIAESEPVQIDSAPQGEAQPVPTQTKKRRKIQTKDASRVFQAGERVTVARRLYRTGESEYEMNGRTCRLRDVQDLFAGTGLGAAHYAIIEQGRIGQVLSAKPLDRRALIEEAAGISKFKMRQHSAELKLEASKQNLSRITDIVAEVERQQNSLKRQAARARRYKRLRQQMRDLMRAVYVVDYRVTSKTLTSLDDVVREISSRESELAASIADRETAQFEATRASRIAEEVLNESREVAANLDLENERARQQQSYLTEQLQSLATRSAQFAKDQAAITERSQFIAQETARLREELQRIEQEINAESRTLAEEEDRHRERTLSDAEAERKLEEARKTVYDCVTSLERWRQLKRQFTDSVDRGRARLEGLAVESERAQAQAQAARDQHAKLTEDEQLTSIRQEEIGNSLSEISDRLVELQRSREERQKSLSALQRDLTTDEQRLKSLAQVEERRTYFSEAVQVLMQRAEQNNGQPNGFSALGTLADFVKVAPEHEAMIETALRDELQYVVVPSFDDALRA
ncbi:MAG: hypothetical protein ACREBD_22975, partial [Blastocatellia bacterium]